MPYPVLDIIGFTASPSEVAVGASVDFSVSLRNLGTAATVASTVIEIRDAQNNFVENVSYDNATIPPSTTIILIKSWSTDSLQPGTYTATATAWYETNATNSVSINFSILEVQQIIGGGGIGAVGETIYISTELPAPTVLPPSIKPLEGILRFAKITVLREIVAGRSAVESIVLENTGDKQAVLRIEVEGLPEEWLGVQPREMILLAGEKRVLNLAISVPDDALPGDYLARIKAVSEESRGEDYIVLRVKAKPTQEEVVFTKRVSLEKSGSTISIIVSNYFRKKIDEVRVTEEIPPEISERISEEDIQFLERTGTVVSKKPLRIEWVLNDLQPNEERTIEYAIPVASPEYAAYAYWAVKQVAVTPVKEALPPVYVAEMNAPEIPAGQEADFTATIFYGGLAPTQVHASLSLPASFEVEPQFATAVLAPRSATVLRFKVRAKTALEGSYLATLNIFSNEFSISKTTTMIVEKPAYVTSLASVESLWVVAVAAAIAVTAAIIFLAYSSRKSKADDVKRREELEGERSTYLSQIRELISVTGRKRRQ